MFPFYIEINMRIRVNHFFLYYIIEISEFNSLDQKTSIEAHIFHWNDHCLIQKLVLINEFGRPSWIFESFDIII